MNTIFTKKGAFGITQGMRIDSEEQIEPGLYEVSPPNEHPAFKRYFVTVNDKQEVFEIRAFTPLINENIYSLSFKSIFETIEEELKAIYGESFKHDLIRPEYDDERLKYLYDPKEFKERFGRKRILSALWGIHSNSTCKSPLDFISIDTREGKNNQGYIFLHCRFDNFETSNINNYSRSLMKNLHYQDHN